MIQSSRQETINLRESPRDSDKESRSRTHNGPAAADHPTTDSDSHSC